MSDKQINAIIAQAEEIAEPTIQEVVTELHTLTCFPRKRLRILAWVHAIAEQAVKVAVGELVTSAHE